MRGVLSWAEWTESLAFFAGRLRECCVLYFNKMVQEKGSSAKVGLPRGCPLTLQATQGLRVGLNQGGHVQA